jgi:hypothetical protein
MINIEILPLLQLVHPSDGFLMLWELEAVGVAAHSQVHTVVVLVLAVRDGDVHHRLEVDHHARGVVVHRGVLAARIRVRGGLFVLVHVQVAWRPHFDVAAEKKRMVRNAEIKNFAGKTSRQWDIFTKLCRWMNLCRPSSPLWQTKLSKNKQIKNKNGGV